jgi:hypothetical protein
MIASSKDGTNKCGFERRAHSEPFVAPATKAATMGGIQSTDTDAPTQGLLDLNDAIISFGMHKGRAE